MIQAKPHVQDQTISESLPESKSDSPTEGLAGRHLFILENAKRESVQAAFNALPQERPRLARLFTKGRQVVKKTTYASRGEVAAASRHVTYPKRKQSFCGHIG
jgi:hypothetical protein